MIKRLGLAALALAVLGVAAFFTVLPAVVGSRMNATVRAPSAPASDRALALHRRLFVSDLHADSLLWDRNLAARGSWGHVDLPRLAEGHVALQAFTVVTQTPRGQNIDRNTSDTDNITLLALAERWPPRTWRSLTERALYQAGRLHALAEGSSGRFVVIRSRRDLESLASRRRAGDNVIGGWLGLEGAHALDGNPENLHRLVEAGFRMVSFVHFFDTPYAGSAHGVNRGGLTAAGYDLLARLESAGVLVDLAHASRATIADVTAKATRPLIVSHTGVRATCDNARNLDDESLARIAATGGVIGIGFWETAVCGTDADAIVRAIRHAAKTVGIDHVALGSDFDGAVTAPFDAGGLALITDALLRDGFSEDDIAKVMGENVLRVLREAWGEEAQG